MGINTTYVFIALCICLIQYSSGLPRDSSVVKTEDVQEINNVDAKSKTEATPTTAAAAADNVPNREVTIPGRVPCDFVEPTEDPICQAHCIPKGYSFGLCTSKVCSCI